MGHRNRNRLSALFDAHASTRRDVIAQGALLAAGAAGLLGFPAEAVAQTGDQPDWRFCNKCNTMFFDGYPAKGQCPAGGAHVSQGFRFLMHFDASKGDGARRQYDWRFCGKCNALFFDGYPNKGRCPAGGGHNAAGWMFGLVHQSPTGWQQNEWRFCNKCNVLFYDGYPGKGSCAAGGGHVAQGYTFYINYQEGVQDKIAAAFRTWLTSNGVTNASLAVMQDGGIIGQFAFGNRQATTEVPVASLSKAITGVCIASLVDAGRLTFQDTIGNRLSTFLGGIANLDSRARNITIEHLLRHTSGITMDSSQSGLANVPNADTSDEVLARTALSGALGGAPGANFVYNNINYALLGMVIHAVTNEAYEPYCRRMALAPRGAGAAHIGSGIRAMGAFGGWEISAVEYANFARAFDPRQRLLSPAADRFINAGTYGLGVNVVRTATGRNLFHHGNWQSSATTPHEFSSFFALWDNDISVVATYDRFLTDAARVALDNGLRTAAYAK